MTTLASHSEYLISSMNWAFISLATSSSTAALLSSPCFLFLCTTGLALLAIASLCVITVSSIPGMSSGFQAKRSTFSFKMARTSLLSSSPMAVPMLVVWCCSLPIWISSSSSMGLTLLSWKSSLGSSSVISWLLAVFTLSLLISFFLILRLDS
ncbi:hypothetical protein QL285_026182 [Trifolium repens]|nr:hypothetical protein QL285_026182 [Trifolium repens]